MWAPSDCHFQLHPARTPAPTQRCQAAVPNPSLRTAIAPTKQHQILHFVQDDNIRRIVEKHSGAVAPPPPPNVVILNEVKDLLFLAFGLSTLAMD